MNLNIAFSMNEADVENVNHYIDVMGKRAMDGGGAIKAILLKHLEPMVAAEKVYLAPHSKSGALEASLQARAGTGDRPGTISVFAAPSATTATLRQTWGQGRAQQRRWFNKIPKDKRGRTAVFYGPIVHQGHGNAAPVPFAADTVDSMGDAAMDDAAEEVLNYIVGV